MLSRCSIGTRVVLLLLSFTLLTVPAMGQSFYGSIVSVVKDTR
jgi:hypothetical protein